MTTSLGRPSATVYKKDVYTLKSTQGVRQAPVQYPCVIELVQIPEKGNPLAGFPFDDEPGCAMLACCFVRDCEWLNANRRI
jgi:hypothetical protein